MALSRGSTPSFYVVMEGRLRILLDVHGKQTEFAEHEFKQGDFLGEVPLLMGTPTFGSLRAQTSCRVARLDKQQFHRLIQESKEARAIILETLGERLLLIQQVRFLCQHRGCSSSAATGMPIAITSAHFFPRTVFLTSGSIVIAIRSGCLPASPTTLIARP